MMATNRSYRFGLMMMAVLAFVPVAAAADSIAWRTSYAAAQQEAVQSGRPVVVSVSSRGCRWCRELERSTYRDPRVVGVLNARAVPLKIDANDPAHEALVDALRLQGVPTLAIISPQGQILANQAGYLDAGQFLGWLGPIVGQ